MDAFERLRVRDVMLRNPATVQACDTIEHCLRKGQQLGVAQFPVVDGERVVGVISANEIFQLAAHCLGAWERRCGVTLAIEPLNRFETYFLNTAADAAALCAEVNHPHIGILFDTFHDHRTAYWFSISAGGVMFDGTMDESRSGGDFGGIDFSWDGIWYAARSREEWGWSAEVVIPFKSIRLSQSSTQEWGVNFGRDASE